MQDSIWINDFSILYKTEKLIAFFPTKKQSNEERINSIIRLSFYISIILSLYHSNVKYFSIFIFFLIFTYVIYSNHPTLNTTNEEQRRAIDKQQMNKNNNNLKLNNFIPNGNNGNNGNNVETIENTNGDCTKPTIANPFMNFTMADRMTFDKDGSIYNRPPACDTDDPEIKKLIDNAFNNNLYKDTSDIFGKMNSQRNYFTMPYTTIVNDQESFTKWLYMSPQTCKQNQDNCMNGNYTDLRGSRFIMPNPENNPISSKKLNSVDSKVYLTNNASEVSIKK